MKSPTYILGISAYFHDSAAALVKDGEVIVAIQEERLTRIKQDSSLPENAIRFCLEEAGISIDEVDQIAYYEKPFVKFERLLENANRTISICFFAVQKNRKKHGCEISFGFLTILRRPRVIRGSFFMQNIMSLMRRQFVTLHRLNLQRF